MSDAICKPAYLEMCRNAFFVASKAVGKEDGYKNLADLARFKTALECDHGAYLGEGGSTKKHLGGKFPEGKPLGANAIVTNEMLGLHHQELGGGDGKGWLRTYLEYGKQTKCGHLILAGTLENFQVWAKSGPCREEVSHVPSGRLFAYIETDLPPHGKRGWILNVDAQANRAAATVNDGEGVVLFHDGAYYKGSLKGGKLHGQGTYSFPDGRKYVGEYRDGKTHGQGTYSFPDGGKYVGEYRDGKMHGQGTYSLANGEKYVGEYRDDKMHGQGTYSFPDGGKYVGEYRDDKMHGQGTYSFPDGGKYVGEYRDGKKHGQGTESYPNGEKYVGEFRDGKKHGQATYSHASGAKYVGEWRDGKKHGQGTHSFPDGGKYVGEYRDGKTHGQGTEYNARGSVVHSGRWENGNPVR